MLAIGRNLNTVIMPFFRYGFEDGIVISEAAAKNLTSEHLYDLSRTLDPRMQASIGRFTTYGKKYKLQCPRISLNGLYLLLEKPPQPAIV